MASLRFMLLLLLSLLALSVFNGMVAADDFCSLTNCPVERCCFKKQEDNTVKVECSDAPMTSAEKEKCEAPTAL